MIRRLAFLILALAAGLSAAAAQGLQSSFRTPPDLVRSSLVAEPVAVAGAQPFTLAVRMEVKPGWHVYWRNPGDSGLPPEVTWTLPAGFNAGALRWPAPERIPIATLMNYGYEGEVTLLVPVTPPPSLDPADPVQIRAKLTYLVCETECVPGSADLALTLPVAEPRPDPDNAALFARARAALPVPPLWPLHLASQGDTLRLDFAAMGLKPDSVRNAAFFPYSETAIDNAAAQVMSVDETGLHLTLARSSPTEPAPAALPGVLTLEEVTEAGPRRLAFAYGDEPVLPTAAPAITPEAPAARAIAPDVDALTLATAAAFAFLGGLILNLMPCVFPVLSIKVLGLIRHAGESPGRLRLHGLAYTAGVLASFLGLAALLIALKGGGAAIGWGFQLQSPIVVAGLAYLLFAMGLSLSGVVHVGGRLAGLGDGLARRAGLSGSFFTGVLATLVATPCTAPFMGSAVGFALTQSAGVALAVFASLGLGLALPFLALTLWPPALRALPRPGAWMEVLKQILAFPVYATVAWLVWVLAQQVDPRGLLAALIGLVLVGFAAWAWERGRAAAPRTGRIAQAAAILAIVTVAALAVTLPQQRTLPSAQAAADGIVPFTQARLDALVSARRPVFIDMTAAWCITCAVNEATSLNTKAVRAAMAERGVTYMKGDWTNQNPEITRLLEKYGRSGVPLYLLYAGTGEPQVLPQILTEGTVLAALDAVPASSGRSAALAR
ncbi:Thiol:disulfide interchange protein DsbD [Methylobacterium tardum]|uniref:Thiol:disulfide interchange protein DsbD n=1 Tax=Methylobacterium tardum TaxID=374432 RepID=A0AA37TCI4_9HYPH|nr:protein-disulfide reductase DsbD domain-containing protein [Methylobacterium tardum]URD37447.1 thioredoxin family protein [Methylobacterium tardum]GJE50138.1 Thiol:disulfide interchange protein DsbD [Methylobacterium tardum]GLS70670.1 thiol:disulfide interchange protein DsbD [Methylobacterium tardum]